MWSQKTFHMIQKVNLQNKGNQPYNCNIFFIFMTFENPKLLTPISQKMQVKSSEKKNIWHFHMMLKNLNLKFLTMWRVFPDHITFEEFYVVKKCWQYLLHYKQFWFLLFNTFTILKMKSWRYGKEINKYTEVFLVSFSYTHMQQMVEWGMCPLKMSKKPSSVPLALCSN